MSNCLILDVATAAIEDVKDFIEKVEPDLTTIKPDGRIGKDNTEKLAADIEAKKAKLIAEAEADYQKELAKAGLDLDFARITAIGLHWQDAYQDGPVVQLCHDDTEERAALGLVAASLYDGNRSLRTIITYGGHNFDLPLLMRRARYLGVTFPTLSTDRYKSTNRDLLLELSDRNPSRSRPLGFYVKRLRMGLTKPLSGEEEAQVFTSGRWDDLKASVEHDLEATRQLATWMGIL